MNRLVGALTRHPEVIDLFAGSQRAPFDMLLRGLGEDLLSEPERHIIRRRAIGRHFRASYLPTISSGDWQGALSQAASRTTSRSGWWTVMVPAADGRSGLTVPQNGSSSELVALFTLPHDDPGILVYDPALGSVTVLVSEPHCGVPSLGKCLPGTCEGCRAATIRDRATGTIGIKCLCSHQGG
jgi:hypothetical protein